jgi:hypothetical protein
MLHRICFDAATDRQVTVNTLKLGKLAATFLLASSLGAISARAATPDGVAAASVPTLCDVADAAAACPGPADPADVHSATDDAPLRGRIAATHGMRDVPGRDINGTSPQLALGPQYELNDKVTLGGEWEPRQPAFATASPEADAYAFGLRILF